MITPSSIDPNFPTRALPRYPVAVSTLASKWATPHSGVIASIVEDFLPRYGCGAEVLYIRGDGGTALFEAPDKLRELQLFARAQHEFPDIIVYSAEKRWLFLIEAVHNSEGAGQISSSANGAPYNSPGQRPGNSVISETRAEGP